MRTNLILFGAGNYGKKAYERLHDKYHICLFADNNPALIGQKVFDVPVVLASELTQYYMNDMDLVLCAADSHSMKVQLDEMGIHNYYIMVVVHGLYYFIPSKPSDKIRRCTRCVMDDSSDQSILFDEKGQCSYCSTALQKMKTMYFPNEEGRQRLDKLLHHVKEYGKGKKYDCIMGLSGGLDSSYLTYLVYRWGLRALIIHIDDGYDTPIAKENIKKLIETTNFDYDVVRPDPEQYNDLTLAFMKAGVPNIAIPQDNIILAYVYRKMKEHHLKYFFSGFNFSLECILQRDNTYRNDDVINIRDIHRKFGTKGIDRLEFLSREQKAMDAKQLHLETVSPLDYVNYNRDNALRELKEFCGYQYYGRKHLENILTAFIQLYWFPKKFGVDKRTSHLSSMIVSGQITRQEAMNLLEEPIYDSETMNGYIYLIKRNMKLSDKDFNDIMNAETHQHNEYATKD